MKTCRDCGVEKPLTEFPGRRKDGYIHSYCKPCNNARGQAWRMANPERYNASLAMQSGRRKEYRKGWRQGRRSKILALLGDKCVHCGFSDERALQIDHVDGGGHTERVALGGQSTFYAKLLREGTDGYQLLCANCNWIKRAERGEYSRKAYPPG